MKKMLLLALLSSALVGCAPLYPDGCHKTTALGDCYSGRFTDQDKFGKQALKIKETIESELADRHAWRGKKCRLHFDFARSGKLENVEIRAGNKQYCAALKTAAQRASFAPFSDPELYTAFSGSRFDFKGE